jgi:polysaccharide transporter, PST family
MEQTERATLVGVGPSPHHRAMFSNASVLLVGQILGLLAPLVVVPYLARTLGPDAWSPVLMAQGLGYWLIAILEFAFDLSGTRAVAQSRTARQSTSGIVQSIQSAKVLLILVAIPIALGVSLSLPTLRADPALIATTLAFAVFRGLSPLWYFQGVERVRGAVAVETFGKLSPAVAMFFAVHGPEHGWRVMGVYALFAAISLVWLTALLAREVAIVAPDLGMGWRTLRENFTLFACRASAGLYVQANALILGAIAPAAVAFFGGAEKIVRAAMSLLYPMNQAVLPRISFLRHSNPDAAGRVVRTSFLVVGAIGAAMSLTALFGAPLLVRILLGPGYELSVPILRLLSPLPFIVAINSVLGIFWAVPMKREKSFLTAILVGGATNLTLVALLVPRFEARGMAISSVMAEVAVFVLLIRAYTTRPV